MCAGGAVVGLERMSRPVTGEHVVCAGAPPTISSVESIIDGNGMPPTIDAIDVVHTLRNTYARTFDILHFLTRTTKKHNKYLEENCDVDCAEYCVGVTCH